MLIIDNQHSSALKQAECHDNFNVNGTVKWWW